MTPVLLAGLLAASALLGVATAAADEPVSRPNFVIVLCDDLGYGDLGCFGHPHIRTPNLDRLAETGLRLTDCYSSAPVCSPSRAGMLSGKTPSRVGVYDWIPSGHPMHLPADTTTVAQLLGDAGYRTAQVGKWHCNGQFNEPAQPQPGDHGFQHWFATQNNAAPRHENPVNFVRNGQPVGKLEGFSCQLVVDEAQRWLKAGNAEHPFYLHVCFHEPHEPVESPDDLVAEYEDVAKNVDEAQYFANVANVDKAVGRLIATLDELGVRDNTFFFFTSDNGPETLDRYRTAYRSYGSPGKLRGMKLHLYEGGIRVPGILSWPGKLKGGDCSVPVCGFDVLPTLCDLAGVAVPDDLLLDGTSFAPLLEGEEVERSQPMFWHYYRAISPPRVAVRDGKWKLVAHWDGPPVERTGAVLGGNVNPRSQEILKSAKLVSFELYDLEADPSETTDLAEAEPEVLRRLSQWTKQRYAEVLAQGPEWDFPESAGNR